MGYLRRKIGRGFARARAYLSGQPLIGDKNLETEIHDLQTPTDGHWANGRSPRYDLVYKYKMTKETMKDGDLEKLMDKIEVDMVSPYARRVVARAVELAINDYKIRDAVCTKKKEIVVQTDKITGITNSPGHITTGNVNERAYNGRIRVDVLTYKNNGDVIREELFRTAEGTYDLQPTSAPKVVYERALGLEVARRNGRVAAIEAEAQAAIAEENDEPLGDFGGRVQRGAPVAPPAPRPAPAQPPAPAQELAEDVGGEEAEDAEVGGEEEHAEEEPPAPAQQP
jgi:hypothetical protein